MYAFGINPVYSRPWGVGEIQVLPTVGTRRRSRAIAWWQSKDAFRHTPRVFTKGFVPPPIVGYSTIYASEYP